MLQQCPTSEVNQVETVGSPGSTREIAVTEADPRTTSPPPPPPSRLQLIFTVVYAIVAVLLTLIGLLGLILNRHLVVPSANAGFVYTIIVTSAAAFLAIFVSGVEFLGAIYCASHYVYCLNFFWIAVSLILSGSALVLAWPAGLLLLLVVIFHSWWFYSNLHRIPLVGPLLKYCFSTLQQALGVCALVVGAVMLQIFTFLLLVGALSFVSSGFSYVVWILFIPMFLWVAEVIKALLYTTCCTVVGIRCYQKWGEKKKLVARSLGRTFSSVMQICYGAVGTGPVSLLCMTLGAMASCQTGRRCHGPMARLDALHKKCLELNKRFSELAFVHVAFHCKSYPESASDTFASMQTDAALVQYELLRSLNALSSWYGGLFTAVIVGMATHNGIFGFYAFLLVKFILGTINQPVAAFVATTLVCFVEDPNETQKFSAVLYEELMEARNVCQDGRPADHSHRPSIASVTQEGTVSGSPASSAPPPAPVSTASMASGLRAQTVMGAQGPVSCGDHVAVSTSAGYQPAVVMSIYPNRTVYVQYDGSGSDIVEASMVFPSYFAASYAVQQPLQSVQMINPPVAYNQPASYHTNQGYAPQHQGYPASSQPYPMPSQDHPKLDQGYAAQSQGYAAQAYAPAYHGPSDQQHHYSTGSPSYQQGQPLQMQSIMLEPAQDYHSNAEQSRSNYNVGNPLVAPNHQPECAAEGKVHPDHKDT